MYNWSLEYFMKKQCDNTGWTHEDAKKESHKNGNILQSIIKKKVNGEVGNGPIKKKSMTYLQFLQTKYNNQKFCVFVYLFLSEIPEREVCIYPTPATQKKDITQGHFLSKLKLVWNQFSFS